ncbi:hypothetical protein NLG97_g6074 [Lecanicillium saksenae]|uniref:Uncharacterized protein n=1 Tax=Lecanicillium saksenae TaxID=468837 RepID=A0ACC1QTV8_9HYPO|nr:hypothetical protein NLG97_g6074 [Lecanicillium saksenae]
MVTKFFDLPPEIRRQIWLATVGPMTLSLLAANPPDQTEQCHPKLCDHRDKHIATLKLFKNFSRYYGHIDIPNRSGQLLFVVDPTGAYMACKESRAILRPLFAEPIHPEGGLPSWFRFDLDTIRCSHRTSYSVKQFEWRHRITHIHVTIDVSLMPAMPMNRHHSNLCLLGRFLNHDFKRFFKGLDTAIFDMFGDARKYEDGAADYWLSEWFVLFEELYGRRCTTLPSAPKMAIVSRQLEEMECLTPQNYLHAIKKWRHLWEKTHDENTCVKDDEYYRMRAIFEAADEELNDPVEFRKKYWGSLGQELETREEVDNAVIGPIF